MSVVDTLRPVSVRKTGAGVAVPSGTLSSVTSDNSDSTYIQFALADFEDNWSLRVGSHTPAAGYQRHQVRARVRIRSNAGTISEDIDLGRGTEDYGFYETVPVTTTFSDQPTSWISFDFFGLDTPGALTDLNIGGGYPNDASGGATQLRTSECYVDIDCRFHPDFSPQIQDNAGVDQSGGTVTDTNQPDLYFGTVAYDGLPALNWAVAVKQGGTTVYSQSGTGQPPATVPTLGGLANGAYTATFTVRSTIRGSDPFEWSISKSFSIDNNVPPPSPPLVSVDREFGGYRVTWTNPSGQAWDNEYVVAEVWREDCTGNQRIATIPDGLNGSYLDLAIPQLDPQPVSGPDCELSSEPCDITYSVRYWGYVSTYVELPDTIPADMILGWPSTAASIPSGWTRVTALDGYYPRGSSGTGVPTGVTGGAASHTHTTDQHRHTINAHSHEVGGSTNSSNSSVTSARYNGAGQSQADQPHAHALPLNTGNLGAVNSGYNSPSTSAASNTPPTRDVIWIKSDGAQANYPVGVLGWATEAVSGWVTDTTSSGRYLKGAAAAGNGGASSGSSTHTHTINAHTHTGVSHTHPIANTGLSIPLSSLEAGYGSATPRYLPRHTHPVTVGTTATDPLSSASGGVTGSGTLEPPHRRLRVLRNTGGGTQTRIIGLFVGAVSALDPLLTLCNGGNGTPDMRGWFARDAGSDSINSTGGFATHGHSTPNHSHATGPHNHSLSIGVSGTGSYEAPTFGDLGSSPSTGHTHTSGASGNTTPSTGVSTSGGNTSIESTLPVFKEVHFVRLDGTISGGPLPVPELKVTEFSTATVPAFTYGDDLDRLATTTEIMAVTTDRSHSYPRLVADSTPLEGGLHSVSTTLAGEDMTLVIAVEGLPAINRLENLLRSDRVYWSPLGGTPGWYAPAGWTVTAPVANVKVLTVTMSRSPWPSTPEPEVYL
jgi:hypothetical protein